jgi:hypothetical protein
MTTRPQRFLLAIAVAAAIAPAVLADPASAGSSVGPAGTNLAPVKSYLLRHTTLLTGFTRDFRSEATRYYTLARAADFDYPSFWASRRGEVTSTLRRARALWVHGNPFYERVEGVVAGTPALARYDMILDAGASALEDPAAAVPFDLRLPNGKVLRQPGNFFNLTEGMLWGTRPELVVRGVRADLDRDGRLEFGEVLPEANALKAAADGFDRYARELDRAARRWRPTASDAFTAVVVMVPTMSEYFGQWKVSRFVVGARASGDAFNVVSRLSDINDILTGLNVIYRGIAPAIGKRDAALSAQTTRELVELSAYVQRLYLQERAGRRFTPEQADVLGREAQERGTAIAGQVSQAAARLKVKIVQ